MLGKKDFDKNFYGSTIYKLWDDTERVITEGLVDLDDRVDVLSGAVTEAYTLMEDSDRVVAEALVDLDARVIETNGIVGSHETRIQALETAVSGLTSDLANLTQRVNDMSLVISAALNDINSRICS